MSSDEVIAQQLLGALRAINHNLTELRAEVNRPRRREVLPDWSQLEEAIPTWLPAVLSVVPWALAGALVGRLFARLLFRS